MTQNMSSNLMASFSIQKPRWIGFNGLGNQTTASRKY